MQMKITVAGLSGLNNKIRKQPESLFQMMQQYIEEQEGEPVADDSRFQIDSS